MNIFTSKLYAANATPCDKRVQIVVSESARHGRERFQDEDNNNNNNVSIKHLHLQFFYHTQQKDNCKIPVA
jgi:hypothetical protein